MDSCNSKLLLFKGATVFLSLELLIKISTFHRSQEGWKSKWEPMGWVERSRGNYACCCSVTQSDSLLPHERQPARLPCPLPSPGVCSNSCTFNWWCHPTSSSSVIPFSSCLQSFPAQGLFKWVSSSHQVAKVFEFQLQYQSFWWIFRINFL